MTKSIVIYNQEARLLALNQQGLIDKFDTNLEAIEQIGYVQIDTISVTERAHHHVLYSRNKQYQKEHLDALMKEKKVFEYWSHAAAYLPMRDYRFSLYRKAQYQKGDNHWFPRDKKVEKYVLDRIKAEGALQSKDFENPRDKNHEWYAWKPAKIALTNLFMDGSIMISERKGFQKVFDLTENVIPNNINTQTPTLSEFCNHLIFNTISNHGLATVNEICYLRKGIKTEVNKQMKQLLKSGELLLVKITENDETYYTTPSLFNSLNNLTAKKEVHILNPFDNIVIQRKRLKSLFDFDYQIECYVPEKKRVFGYYTLPILYGTEFVGRMDAKADRKTKLFTVKNIWWENDYQAKEALLNKLNKEIKDYASFCGCDEVTFL